MCGIFGVIRNLDAPHPERASAAFVELGRRAVERGRDSAGFALLTPDPTVPVTGAYQNHLAAHETDIDNVHVVKDVCSFDDLWDDARYLPRLNYARIALGHTRWATQGKRDSLLNASPLIVGSLVGTHNGDVDTKTVTGKWSLPKPYGSTDTEVLYQAIDRDRRDRSKITKTLRNVEGRAALAWVDRHKQERVYLSRAALSPLSIAFDAEGNLYWASNPRWFRQIDAMFNGTIGFHSITLVEEGTLMTVSVADSAPEVEDVRRFTPTCRPSDARLSDAVVWRGFDAADTTADKAQTRHKVAVRASASSKYDWSYTGAGGDSKGPRKTGGGHGGWDMSQPGYAPAKTSKALPAASATATGPGSVPDYTDRLDGIATREFLASEEAYDVWDADEFGADQSDSDEMAALTEEEAMYAACQWVEDGGDSTVLGIVRNASLPSEIEDLMDEFNLSTVAAFYRFRDIMATWSAEASAEATVDAQVDADVTA